MTTGSLAAAKQNELDKALDEADAAGEVISFDIPLVQSRHATTNTKGFDLILADKQLANADVVILQHKDSDIVQFFFPEDTLQPEQIVVEPNKLAMSTFGFLPTQNLELLGLDMDRWHIHRGLNIFKRTAEKAVEEIARVAEKAKKKEGLIALAHGYTRTTDEQLAAQLAASMNKRVLLFVHGIFSSIEGGFHALGKPDGSGSDNDDLPKDLRGTLKELLERYDNNVFGYDHWTISKTPAENARDLLKAIPNNANWTVDLVCHSRGGLITRAMFADPAVDAALQTPELREIQSLRKNRISEVGKVIFVAGANQGSPLANPEQLKKFLKIAGVLASKSHCFALDMVIGLLRTLISAAYEVPSVVQLDSKRSNLIADLELKTCTSAIGPDNAYGVRANFDHGGWKWREAAALVDKLLMPGANDLVVPYAGVATNPYIPDEESRLRSFEQKASQSAVWHTNYFEQKLTHDFLKDHLTN